MSPPELCSVIVPSYRSAATIDACLTALQQQDYESYEVIVVDSSDDGAVDRLSERYPEVRVLKLLGRADPAKARNAGAAAARGDLLAFIDSDCVAAPG